MRHESRSLALPMRAPSALRRYVEADRRVRTWVRFEFRRRMFLRMGKGTPCRVVLLSYPRSGSHATRTFLEAATHRPTLGASDSERTLLPRIVPDIPIFLRPGVRIPVSNASPIALKRHSPPDFAVRQCVLIIRDPREAVMSHLRPSIDGRIPMTELSAQVEAWKAVLEWPLGNDQVSVFVLRFEDIVSEREEAMTGLLDFLGIEASASDIDRGLKAMIEAGPVALRRAPQSHDDSGSWWRRNFPKNAALIEAQLSHVAPNPWWGSAIGKSGLPEDLS